MQNSQPDGFLAMPPAGKGDAVLVFHAWWGLNDTLRAFCTRLAGAGYLAFAPDLYHGKVADTIEGAEALAGELDAHHEQALADVHAAAQFLQAHAGTRTLAVIGFSLGAFYALRLATTAPEGVRAVVLFYGTGYGDFNQSQAAFLGHFAENDVYEPAEGVAELEAEIRQAGRPVTFHDYPGTGHWFFEADRTQAYDPDAAVLAWERTLAFLQSAPTA